MERDFARRRLERKLAWTHLMMLLTVLALTGFILGFMLYVVAGIGFLLLLSALVLRYTAYWRRDDPNWTSEIHVHRFIMAAFGGGAVLGFAARLWIEMM